MRAHDTGAPHADPAADPIIEPADPGAGPLDPARLGMAQDRLRELFGEDLRETEVPRPRSLLEQIRDRSNAIGGGMDLPESPEAAPAAERFPEQVRLRRPVGRGGIAAAEYELFRGTVYRIRWQLGEPFERPISDALVAAATDALGPPAYDQVLKAKLASPRAELRRAGWTRGDRSLEVRQLHPLHGGPLYLSVTDTAAAGRILETEGTPMPEPDSSGPWRERGPVEADAVTPAERRALVDAFRALLAAADFPAAE